MKPRNGDGHDECAMSERWSAVVRITRRKMFVRYLGQEANARERESLFKWWILGNKGTDKPKNKTTSTVKKPRSSSHWRVPYSRCIPMCWTLNLRSTCRWSMHIVAVTQGGTAVDWWFYNISKQRNHFALCTTSYYALQKSALVRVYTILHNNKYFFFEPKEKTKKQKKQKNKNKFPS